MRQIKHWLNYTPDPSKQESNKQPSETIPSQTLSIQEILERHTRGQSSGVRHMQGTFSDSNEPLPNIKKLDLSETEELIDNLKNNQNAIEKELNQRQEKQMEEAIKAKIAEQEAKKTAKQLEIDTTPKKE